jgi:hypothetical protein
MQSSGERRDALLITAPEELAGKAFSLETEHLTIGRAEDNDVRLEDPYVSRRHAVVHRAGGSLVIEDAGSRGGVTINGVAVRDPSFLREGDVVGIGKVEFRVVQAHGDGDAPSELTLVGNVPSGRAARASVGNAPAPPRVTPVAPPPAPRFALNSQSAGAISNVAGNQYNVEALRLAPMRQRARWVLRTGLAMILVGLAVSVIGDMIWQHNVTTCSLGEDCIKNTTGLTVLQFGGVIFTLAVIVIIVSLFMRREVKKQEARL